MNAKLDTDARPADAGGATDAHAPESVSVPAPIPHVSQTERAFQDIVQGARSVRLWGLLGWYDIRARYRRSRLGPFWLTISMGVQVGALGMLYGVLFKVDAATYVPFLTLGFVVWGLPSGLIADSCVLFAGAAPVIRQSGLPLSLHVYRAVWRNLIVFGHTAVIYVVVMAIFPIWPGWTGLLALPGLALCCLSGVWAAMLVGTISARFRDLPPIINSVMRLLFLVTPIIWMPELVPERARMLELNPLFHYMEVVRAPLLGQVPGLVSWLVVSGLTLGGWAVTFVLFRACRKRIAYWI